jgi:hypothetical protein
MKCRGRTCRRSALSSDAEVNRPRAAAGVRFPRLQRNHSRTVFFSVPNYLRSARTGIARAVSAFFGMRFASFAALTSMLVLAAAGVAAAQAPPPNAPPPNAPPVLAGSAAYRLFADVVTSGLGKPGVQGENCVTQTVFFPGDTIVWRAVIADGPTGSPLTAADVTRLGLTATVALSDGSKVPLRLGTHPPPPNAPAHSTFWSGSLSTKSDHPTGTLKWTLTVADNAGHTATFEPMGQADGSTILTLAQRAAAPRS